MTATLSSLRNQSIWALFDGDISLTKYAALKDHARQSALMFDFFQQGLTQEDQDLTRFGKIENLDTWVVSDAGQNALARLAQDLQDRIRKVGHYALPAHDLRQILYKDATEGLRFAKYEEPQGYKSAFIIPMFCHDIGRLLEGKFFKLGLPMSEWIPHNQLSYLLLRETLDDHPEIPTHLKNHFLYAVLAHSGENGKTYMSRAVQACDRMQMIGPEGFFRAVSFMMGLLPNGELAYPHEEAYQRELPHLWHHTSVLSVMEHVGRNMYPNIGENHKEWQDFMQLQNTGLLWHMGKVSPKLRDSIFGPELGKVPETSLGMFKQKFSTAHMMAVRDIAEGKGYTPPTADEFHPAIMAGRLCSVLENPLGAAKLTRAMRLRIYDAVQRVKPEDMAYLAVGINYAIKAQQQLDREDNVLISRILGQRGTDPLTRTIATEAQLFAHSGVIPLNLSLGRNQPRFTL